MEEAACGCCCHRRSLGGEPLDLAARPHRELGRAKAVGGGDVTIIGEQLLVEKADFVAKHRHARDGCRRRPERLGVLGLSVVALMTTIHPSFFKLVCGAP